MKKMIMILGYIFMALIAVLAAGMAILAVVGHTLDKESKAFVDAAIPAIVSEWDVGELKKRASPEFEETADYDDVQQLFDLLQSLGELKEYKGSTGDANITLSLQNGYDITADYDAIADFEAGSVGIQLSLVKHDSQWQILDLKINPEEYTERKDII